jgi:hypothetical protein
MKKYLIITDITGKQYPYLLNEEGLYVDDVLVTNQGDYLDQVKYLFYNKKIIRVGNRLFNTAHIVEVSTQEIPEGAY